jgi:hypothetical protein
VVEHAEFHASFASLRVAKDHELADVIAKELDSDLLALSFFHDFQLSEARPHVLVPVSRAGR